MPDNLKDAKVYAVDMASMVAGTQYRGDFEKRLKMVLDSLEKEPHAIVYLDEIHTVIGAGAVNGVKTVSDRGEASLYRCNYL